MVQTFRPGQGSTRRRSPAEQRRRRALAVAASQSADDGVVHRAELRALGVTKEDVRAEVRAGRWHRAGRHTIVVAGTTPQGRGMLWQAVWESGPGAVLDGAAALVAHGLTGFRLDVIDVSVPTGNDRHPMPGVVARRCRSWASACRASPPTGP